jgi:hypothetical protein
MLRGAGEVSADVTGMEYLGMSHDERRAEQPFGRNARMDECRWVMYKFLRY